MGATSPRLAWGRAGSRGPVAGVWVACARPGTCVCPQRVHTGVAAPSVALAWLSCPLDPGWELQEMGQATRRGGKTPGTACWVCWVPSGCSRGGAGRFPLSQVTVPDPAPRKSRCCGQCPAPRWRSGALRLLSPSQGWAPSQRLCPGLGGARSLPVSPRSPGPAGFHPCEPCQGSR